ncbi:MAG: RNA methyltransferase [Anaerolineales bacterium]
MITSRSNPYVKSARALRQRKYRQQSGLFLVEGIRQVADALESSFVVERLFYAPEMLNSAFAQQLIAQAQTRGVDCLSVSADVFASLAEKENPQGILAVARWPQHTLAGYSLPEDAAWSVALVAPQDPGNIGTILRTMDAVGAQPLFLLDGGADPTHPSVVRASLGALFWIPVISCTFDEFVIWCRRHSYTVYGTSAHGQDTLQTLRQAQPPGVLLLGSERTGLAEARQAVCHALIRLPMQGHVSSLNLGVSAGIFLYALYEGQSSDINAG